MEFSLKALDIRKKSLGEDHSDTATSYNNIGSIYHALGDLNKALEFSLKDLEITKKLLGEDHFSTATSYNNIG